MIMSNPPIISSLAVGAIAVARSTSARAQVPASKDGSGAPRATAGRRYGVPVHASVVHGSMSAPGQPSKTEDEQLVPLQGGASCGT
jgi:hypothetical protein